MQDEADELAEGAAQFQRNNRRFAIGIVLAFCAASGMAAALSLL